MERNCQKCIHHISGLCSKWDCEMTTLEDYRNKVIDEFAEVLKEEYVFDSICRDDVSKYEYENKIDRIVKQMKEGI